ncbi:helix-turn-helix domain-containing protein [Peribacillus sp. TH27]|uniref:helix-turn-helix domain-containing protein n=1 Tax=Peribacillus sp. TH27 TaxID=2798484 RepID=UPI001912ABB9|nr:helix-turn-helix transcriptional regulator [Peribacillus sp. TH27]MBK5463374.1 helix-turn-helix transcriptional regulator [Peribacillus sp. TH27]
MQKSNNKHSETMDRSEANDSIEYLSNRWSSKINNFLVLCIYEQNNQYHDFNKVFKSHKLEGSTGFLTFKDGLNNKSFVIWENAYKENEELFAKLRLTARNETISQIAQNVVFYLLCEYERISSKSHAILKEKQLIEDSIYQMEKILKKDTFLAEKPVWDEFNSWFRLQIKECILEEIAISIGFNEMERLDVQELNKLFYHFLTKNFAENKEFVSKITYIVNGYTQEWVDKIIFEFNLETSTIEKIENLLCFKKDSFQTSDLLLSTIRDFSFNLTIQDHLLVMNSAPYQSVRDAIYKKNFGNDGDIPWPATPIQKGNTEGFIQIIPIEYDHTSIIEHAIVKEAWNRVQLLSDVDVDVFDALCSLFLSKARHNEEIVEIYLNDLLSIRGLKPKLGGDGRRGGYEARQREQILKSLTNIQSIWININKAVIYEKGKPVQTTLQGRTFIFKDYMGEEYGISEETCRKKITFTIDKVFAKYLNGSARQVALLSIKALQYNPYRQIWEKRLTRYLSWRWRTQARKGDFLQPNKTSTLLESIGEKMNNRTPSRTRERFEKALDTLLEDGVIASWHYEKWDESIADYKGWASIWLNSMILIEPPEIIKDQYRSIEKKQKVRSDIRHSQQESNSQKRSENIGEQIRITRKILNLSLYQLAEELEISAPYVSNIERGIKRPSHKIRTKMIKWLEKQEHKNKS